MTKKRPFSLQANDSFPLHNFPLMVSGCLLGLHCRYDGGECGSSSIIRFASSAPVIPFCPEQLGGLSTPRSPANISGGDGYDVLTGKARVINRLGEDVTEAFIKGARESLHLPRIIGVKIALMKDKSPSCGTCTPCCESVTDSGSGVTAALFKLSGIEVISVEPDDHFPNPEFIELLKVI